MNDLQVEKNSVTPIIDAMQYDAGRIAEFTLSEDMTGKYAEYSCKIDTSRIVKGHCDISDDNIAFFCIPQNVTCQPGQYAGSITFYDSSEMENAISSFPFLISVIKNPRQDEDVYEAALSDMKAATSLANDASNSATSAASNANQKAQAAQSAADDANSKASAANSAAAAANAAASTANTLITKMENLLSKWEDADFSQVLSTVSQLQEDYETINNQISTVNSWKESVDQGNDDVMVEVSG